MSEKICKYNKDEFCVNDKCPMCADYCPVAQNPGVCKYEELVVDDTSLTPKECLRKAFAEQKYPIGDIGDFDTDEIIKKFLKFMTECGHIQEISVQCNTTEDNKQHSEEFVVGKRVHVGAIGASKDWEYVGEQNDRDVYMTKDKLLMVSFNKYDESVWGTIMLNREHGGLHQCGGIVEGDEIRLFDLIGNHEWHKTSEPSSYGREEVTYTSKDGKLIASFDAECDIAIVTRVK